jgi:alcohol dehydrogenase
MGFRTVAIGRGGDKQPLARKLGAHDYIDTGAGDHRLRPCRNWAELT